MISDLTTCTPREIDSALADLLQQEYRQSGRLATALDSVHHAANDRRSYGRGRSRWGMSDQAAIDKAQRIANSDQTYIGQAAAQYLQKLAHEQAELARIRTESKTLNDEYIRRGRWTRAFLVTNGNGHVHSSMSCSTCNRGGQSTQFQWLVEFSDHDESEVVAAAGWRACTVCYPSAPVGDEKSLPTSIFSEDDKARAAARADREAAKAKRQADKIAKALTRRRLGVRRLLDRPRSPADRELQDRTCSCPVVPGQHRRRVHLRGRRREASGVGSDRGGHRPQAPEDAGPGPQRDGRQGRREAQTRRPGLTHAQGNIVLYCDVQAATPHPQGVWTGSEER